jgi:uncharacterized protein
MRKHFSFAILLLLAASSSFAQQKDYKVVFDITTKDTLAHQTVVRQATLITNSNPDAQVEIVLFGQSLGMITRDKSVVAADVQRLLQNKNVSIKVCEVTMKRQNLDKSQLIAGVTTVPDGIYEIITKQKEGWGYIKVAQ